MGEKLKKILKTMGKAVIVEGDEPKYVVMSVDEYLQLSGNQVKTPPDYTREREHGQSAPPRPATPEPAVDLSEIDTSDLDNENYRAREVSADIDLDDLPL